MSFAGCKSTLFCVLLLLRLAASGKPQCHQISGKLELLNDTDVCIVDPTIHTLGNAYKPAMLDFSRADPKTLNDFLGKNNGIHYFFTAIDGAIVMDGNSNVEQMNFDGIVNLYGTQIAEYGVFINICNNPKLKTITIKLETIAVKKVYFYIYNNPQLDVNSLATIIQRMADNANILAFIQNTTHECQFAHPVDPSKYTNPTDEILQHCKTIKGDFILEGGAPPSLTVRLDASACLRLVDMRMPDLANIALPANEQKGVEMCKNGKKSEITGNAKLCKATLDKLEEYFVNSSKVTIEVDESCAQSCTPTDDIMDKFTLCNEIEGDARIGSWFTDPKSAKKATILEKATRGKLSIVHSDATTVDLPALKEVDVLVVKKNKYLMELKLPQLEKINGLEMKKNPQLFLGEINKLHRLLALGLKTFSVECITTENTVMTNLSVLDLCTSISGSLTLEGLQVDVKQDRLKQLTKVEGCLTVRQTNLTNLDFLKGLRIICMQQHFLENNPQLCPIVTLNGVPVVNENLKRRCGASCNNTLSQGCVKAFGDIWITGDTSRENIEDLEYIEGSLTISDTALQRLSFPKLEEITGKKEPLLRVVNNVNLALIDMPAIKKIALIGSGKGNGKPLVEIRGNYQLENVRFLPEGLRNKCTQGDERRKCLYDKQVKKEAISLAAKAILIVVSIAYAVLLASCLYLCCSQEWRDAQEVEETRRRIDEKIANPRTDYFSAFTVYWDHLKEEHQKKMSPSTKKEEKSSQKPQPAAKTRKRSKVNKREEAKTQPSSTSKISKEKGSLAESKPATPAASIPATIQKTAPVASKTTPTVQKK